MKYSEGSVRLLHDDLWQVRYCYQVEDADGKKINKQVSRNFHAKTQREAQQEKVRIHDELERTAILEEMMPVALGVQERGKSYPQVHQGWALNKITGAIV